MNLLSPDEIGSSGTSFSQRSDRLERLCMLTALIRKPKADRRKLTDR